MTQDEFKKFWGMIKPQNETTLDIDKIHASYLGADEEGIPERIVEGLALNGIANLAKIQKQDSGQTMMYFGAKTVNNLPLLFEVAHPHNGNKESVKILFKVPVLPLKPLLQEALLFIFIKE